MTKLLTPPFGAWVLFGIVCGGIPGASAASLINAAGTVALGINPEGHLNTFDPYALSDNTRFETGGGGLGIARVPSPGDATYNACLCEGWGVSVNNAVSVWASVDNGGISSNLVVNSFVTDDLGTGPGSYATSVVSLSNFGGLTITQAYSRSLVTGNAFQNLVTITNTTGATVTDVKYVRLVDWDVPPTEFFEFVSIVGTGFSQLERSHDNGFNTVNPLGGDSSVDPATEDVDFADVGPTDHGAYFRFNFDSLANGESKIFSIFYGAGADNTEAMASLTALAPEVYSLGKSALYDAGTDSYGPNNDSAVYFLAFKGLGSPVVTLPPTVPDAANSVVLLVLGLMGLGGVARVFRSGNAGGSPAR